MGVEKSSGLCWRDSRRASRLSLILSSSKSDIHSSKEKESFRLRFVGVLIENRVVVSRNKSPLFTRGLNSRHESLPY